MDRTFDYSQKILVAVEITDEPRRLQGLPSSYSVFQRVAIPEVQRAFEQTHGLVARLFGAAKFHQVLDQHMGYWEQRIAAGKGCFVHYAIGPSDVITAAHARVRDAGGWTACGVYHVEAQSSAYPFAFPTGVVPSHFHLGETCGPGPDSIYWFNFFPAQPYLFEKTFAIWALFQVFQGRERGECNQLVAVDDPNLLQANGVDPFVLVNLNRFSSMVGYFNSAHEAGKYTFTVDPEYLWYGMLLRKIA